MKIAIALDGSKRAEAALERAAALAREGNGELLLVNVFSPFVDTADAPGATPEEHRTHVAGLRQAYLRNVATSLPGIRTELVVAAQHKAEDADQCIARVASEHAADILVVTSKQASGLVGLVLGSTAQGLLRISPCPVLVVRPEDH